MMSDHTLHQKLSEANRRIRLLLVSQWAARILCWTALACMLWLLASKIRWAAEPSPTALGAILLVSALVGVVIGLTRPVSQMAVARLTDEKTGLKERLSGAVEFEKMAGENAFARVQMADANAHAKDLDLRRVYPFRITREMVASAALALITFLILLIPTIPLFWSKEKKQEMAEVKAAGIVMEKLIRDVEKKHQNEKVDEAKKAAKEAQKLAEAMKKTSVNKKAALVQMAKLTKQMQEQMKQAAGANEPNRLAMQKAAEDIKKSLEDRQKQIEQSAKMKAEEAKKAGKGENGEKNNEKNGDKQNAKSGEKPGEKAGKNGENKPTEAMKQAQQALQKFAQALADQNADMQNQALQELADQMQKGEMTPQEMQGMQQQLQQMAEALKNTDLKNASEQMKQMAEMMKAMKLDPETLKKLAEMMRKAGGQCKGGGPPPQLDAKALAELLQALKEGKLKLCSGGGSNGLPIPIPGIGKGGKGGGKGSGGQGVKTNPLKNDVANSPKLVAVGKNGAATVDARASKEFMKYAAMGHKDSKFKPNTMVKGTRNKNFTELQQNFKGDPDSQYTTGTPLYQTYVNQKRSAESPVNKENIPAAYRKQVKEYFESINPNK